MGTERPGITSHIDLISRGFFARSWSRVNSLRRIADEWRVNPKRRKASYSHFHPSYRYRPEQPTTQGVGAFAAIKRDDRAAPSSAFRIAFRATEATTRGTGCKCARYSLDRYCRRWCRFHREWTAAGTAALVPARPKRLVRSVAVRYRSRQRRGRCGNARQHERHEPGRSRRG